VASFPEQALAEASRTSLGDAGRTLERASTVEVMPALGDALADGTVTGGHVDVVGTALRRLEPGLRPGLIERAEQLVAVAVQASPDEFARALSVEVARLEHDDGMGRLERQKRNTRLRSWVDRDGMWRLAGRFDPDTGVRLQGRLRTAVDTLFTEQVPEHCPSDPLERQDFLRAHALVALTEGKGQRPARPEVVVVVDTTSPDPAGGPCVDWGLPVELPSQILLDLFEVADTHPVIVRNGVVLYAPGQLNLGRTTRLANRAQRRALAALYPTCAIPGCTVPASLCKAHHVIWWENGGFTDLVNLVPLCCWHHHAIHDRGWQLTLTPDRRLTIEYPDGTCQTTGPPTRGPTRCTSPTPSDVRIEPRHRYEDEAAGAPTPRREARPPLDGVGYFKNLLVVLSARILPPVWQVGQ
jgi:hypothetical protein